MGSLTADPVRRMRSGRLRSQVQYCERWVCWYGSDFAGEVLTPASGVDSGATGADWLRYGNQMPPGRLGHDGTR